MRITHLFFDVGGVLGTGGWDTEQRAAAADRFALDAVDLGQRHQEVVGMFEEGRMTLDEYLDVTVFHMSRAFTREEFKAFMRAQSEPFPHAIGIARELAHSRRYRLMTINNESAELNLYRLRRFRLIEIFAAFFSSCWLGVVKPSRRIYELALAMSQANSTHSVFIDDREQNLAPASAGPTKWLSVSDGTLTSKRYAPSAASQPCVSQAAVPRTAPMKVTTSSMRTSRRGSQLQRRWRA